MQQRILLIALLVCSGIILGAQSGKDFELALYFDTDRHELTEQHQQLIDQALRSLRYPAADYQVSLSAHTDARGSLAYNEALSQRRGRSIADYLALKGFSQERVALQAEGETRPVADNSAETGMSLNRRLLIHWQYQPVLAEPSNLLPVMKVKFDAAKGAVFSSPHSQSKVKIPGGILVDAQGRPVTGNVELRYREWRNFYEYLSFGQNMHYHDARGDFFFNSNGMFEVGAFQNDEPVFVAPGKSFTVEFDQQRPDLDNVDLYQYSPQSGQWAALNQPGAALNTPVSDWDVQSGNNRLRSGECVPSMIRLPEGEKPARLLAQTAQIGYELATGQRPLPNTLFLTMDVSDTALLTDMERSRLRIERYDDTKPFFFISDLQGYFGELEAYAGMQFEYVPSIKGDDFSVEKSNMPWQAVYLSLDDDINSLYNITLINETHKIRFKARLRRTDGRILERDVCQSLHQQYRSIQKKRWDRLLVEVTALRRFVTLSLVLREGEERCMKHPEWLGYFTKNRKMMAARYQKHVNAQYEVNADLANELIFNYNNNARDARLRLFGQFSRGGQSGGAMTTALSLFNFGIYNCDQIYRLGAGARAITAQFKTQDGRAIQPARTDVVEKSSQMLLSAPTPQQIYYAPDKLFDVIVRDAGGRVYLLREKTFATLSLAEANKIELVMEDITDQVKTPKDWIKVLGI